MNTHGKIEKSKQVNLKDPETYELAAELAKRHGDTLNGIVKTALKEKLERDEREATKQERLDRIVALSEWYSTLPVKDGRTPEEILGYDENGLPT